MRPRVGTRIESYGVKGIVIANKGRVANSGGHYNNLDIRKELVLVEFKRMWDGHPAGNWFVHTSNLLQFPSVYLANDGTEANY